MFSQSSETEINVYKASLDLVASLFWLLLKILVPKLMLVIGLGMLFITIIASFIGFQAYKKEQDAKETIANASYFSGGKGIEQKFIVASGKTYGLPLIQDKLNENEKTLLTAIRVAEWETRNESNLDGDRDSCGAYQQRLSELAGNTYLAKKVKEVIGNDVYNSVFTQDRVEFLMRNKDSQLRNKSITLTFDYGVAHPFTGTHKGLDFGYFTGETVPSIDTGKVVFVGVDVGGGGNVVIVKHEKLYSLYAHLDKQLVKVDDEVIGGQVIGLSGNTGSSSAPHLHFQLMKSIDSGWNNDVINPDQEPFLTSVVANKFLGLCHNLTQIHLRTGLFDILALERLKNEEATKAIFTESKTFDKETLISLACASQRPIEFVNGRCIEQGWKERARRVIN
ncbi:MAG: M23 family metallopeptidase [Waterburya sp.]